VLFSQLNGVTMKAKLIGAISSASHSTLLFLLRGC
jgi:hypothetical protein